MAEYNGWTNYETWCVSMWLDNDEGNYHAVRELTSQELESADDEPELATRPLAAMLYEYVAELPEVEAVTEGPASFVVDLLGAALSEVNWTEIATNLIEEVNIEANV